MFWCPGCECVHGVNDQWTFNGDDEKPTFSPSLKSTTGSKLCHLFIREGQLQFLADSTHQYAGQTIDIPEWPFDENNERTVDS